MRSARRDSAVERGKELATKKKQANEVAPDRVELDPRAKLTREQLERYLWAAADILRGSIDSSDYKNFIFGLLFLKRLSDRFEEECEELRKEGADPEDPDEHQFFVPKLARWPQIQKAAMGLGEVLNKASAALEEANTPLEGVLAGIDHNDERKLGDAKQRDSVLHRLVQHFAGLVLRNDHLSEPDMLGRAYEYLIEKFADDAGKKGGESTIEGPAAAHPESRTIAKITRLIAPPNNRGDHPRRPADSTLTSRRPLCV